LPALDLTGLEDAPLAAAGVFTFDDAAPLSGAGLPALEVTGLEDVPLPAAGVLDEAAPAPP
jgi:hypothetical protein